MLSADFWTVLVFAIINLVIAIISREKGKSFIINLIAFVICGICAVIIFSLNYNETHKKEPVTIAVENVKEVQIDTTYITTKENTDTIYTIKYLKYD